MKLYELGLYEKALPGELGMEQKLIIAGDCGFDFLQISIDETDEKIARLNMSKAELNYLNNLMSVTGVPIRSMCLSAHRKYPLGSENTAVRQKSLDIMQKALDLSAALGIRQIQLAGYDVYYEKGNEHTQRLFLENLAKSAEMAAKAGIILAFETMETPFMDTTAKAVYYVKRINSCYLQVYPDIGNLNNAALLYGHDVWEDLKTAAGHISELHLKETEPGKYRNMMYGEGCVDFSKAIDTAWDMGVRRYVTEFWYLGNPNWKDDIKKAHAYFTPLLTEKGILNEAK
ncbi:L-ribulose-5-phosphate 3-epimerase [Treponema sp. HNW]|uniref:L-ribulose-5-phosphate 3-epimerase n=1 Tax=Treponema sp. HNW TaxID=3116654 RepID=UPI003D0BDF95